MPNLNQKIKINYVCTFIVFVVFNLNWFCTAISALNKPPITKLNLQFALLLGKL